MGIFTADTFKRIYKEFKLFSQYFMLIKHFMWMWTGLKINTSAGQLRLSTLEKDLERQGTAWTRQEKKKLFSQHN